jgi:hypothetical protein
LVELRNDKSLGTTIFQFRLGGLTGGKTPPLSASSPDGLRSAVGRRESDRIGGRGEGE